MTAPTRHTPLSDDALELVAARFRVLGEPSRLRLIRALQTGERTVGQLVEETGLTQTNTSRHLQTLTGAGVLGRRREGLNVVYFIADPGIFELCRHVCGSLEQKFTSRAAAFRAGPRAVRGAGTTATRAIR